MMRHRDWLRHLDISRRLLSIAFVIGNRGIAVHSVKFMSKAFFDSIGSTLALPTLIGFSWELSTVLIAPQGRHYI